MLETSRPGRVVCLGEALIDRLGPPGGDPSVDRPVDDRLGGAPANVACALARLGTPAAFLGRVGEDAIGVSFQTLFETRGVDRSGLQIDPERPTRVVLVRRDRSGERTFQGFSGDGGSGFADQALSAQSLAEAWPQIATDAAWLLIGTIPLATPHSAKALHCAVDLAQAQGTSIALDVNWRPTFWDPSADPVSGPTPVALEAIQPLLNQAALIKLAREEALWLFGSDDPAVIQGALPQHPGVVVTDGAQPVRCRIEGVSVQIAAFRPPEVVDTTGAGDAFTAGLLHRWAAPVPDRLRFAAACGALVCGGAGAIDPQPTEAEVALFGEMS